MSFDHKQPILSLKQLLISIEIQKKKQIHFDTSSLFIIKIFNDDVIKMNLIRSKLVLGVIQANDYV